MMKTTKMMIAAILLCGTGLNAQAQNYYETKHEVAVAVGGPSNSEIVDVFSNMFSTVISAAVTSIMTGGNAAAYYTYGDWKDTPSISAEYFYHVNKTIGIGAVGAFTGMSRDMYITYTNLNNNETVKEKTGRAAKQFYTIMPTVKIDWLRKKNVGLYSKIGAGMTLIHETQKDDEKSGMKGEKTDYSKNSVMFNFQVSAIGVEVGSPKFRGFAELGYGEQGIALIGLRYKF